MIPEEGRGNLQKQNEGIKESTNCILPHHPGNGRTASLPRSWSFADLNVHDIDYKMGFQPGGECWLCSIRLHQSVESVTQVLHTWCSSWPGGLGMSQWGGITPRGWELEFTSGWLWHPLKKLVQANCDKVS